MRSLFRSPLNYYSFNTTAANEVLEAKIKSANDLFSPLFLDSKDSQRIVNDAGDRTATENVRLEVIKAIKFLCDGETDFFLLR